MAHDVREPWWVQGRFLLFAGIVLFGVFLRFYLLHELPPGLYPDEAMNGLDAIRALDRADFRVFYPDNNGREGLYVNIVALAFQMFHASAYVLRAVSALLGTLTIAAVGFLGFEVGARLKELLGRHAPSAIMLFSAALIAVSSWHVHFSRIGFRAVLLPLLSTLALAYLLRMLRHRRLSDAAFSGFALGLSLSTYIASRILPLVMAIPAAFDLVRRRADRMTRRLWAMLIAGAVLAVFPLAGYFVAHPADFLGRAGSVSIFAVDNPFQAFLISAGKTLLMFHVLGDVNWRHGAAGVPVLDILTGLLLITGLAVMMLKAKKNPTLWLLLIWFGAMLLPAAATFEGLPHALRAFGAIVPAIMLAAVGGVWLWRVVKKRIPDVLRFGLLSFVFILLALMNFHRTFYAWGGATAELNAAFRTDLVLLSNLLNDRLVQHNTPSEKGTVSDTILDYVIVNEGGVLLDPAILPAPTEASEVKTGGIAMPAATIKFLTLDDPRIRYLRPDQLSKIEPVFSETLIMTTKTPDTELDGALRAAFPSIEREDHDGFVVYRL